MEGFAAISLGPAGREFAGLLVEPSAYPDSGDDPWYELQWWNQDRSDENGTPIMIVKPGQIYSCLLYTSPSPRDGLLSRMPSSA